MKQQINAANAPAAIGPYCHAIEMEGFISPPVSLA